MSAHRTDDDDDDDDDTRQYGKPLFDTSDPLELPQIRADNDSHRLYTRLNIPTTATQTQITHAYRALAAILHPDKHAGGSKEQRDRAEEAFRDVKRAYEVLSNPATRELYDKFGEDALEQKWTVGHRVPTATEMQESFRAEAEHKKALKMDYLTGRPSNNMAIKVNAVSWTASHIVEAMVVEMDEDEERAWLERVARADEDESEVADAAHLEASDPPPSSEDPAGPSVPPSLSSASSSDDARIDPPTDAVPIAQIDPTIYSVYFPPSHEILSFLPSHALPPDPSEPPTPSGHVRRVLAVRRPITIRERLEMMEVENVNAQSRFEIPISTYTRLLCSMNTFVSQGGSAAAGNLKMTLQRRVGSALQVKVGTTLLPPRRWSARVAYDITKDRSIAMSTSFNRLTTPPPLNVEYKHKLVDGIWSTLSLSTGPMSILSWGSRLPSPPLFSFISSPTITASLLTTRVPSPPPFLTLLTLLHSHLHDFLPKFIPAPKPIDPDGDATALARRPPANLTIEVNTSAMSTATAIAYVFRPGTAGFGPSVSLGLVLTRNGGWLGLGGLLRLGGKEMKGGRGRARSGGVEKDVAVRVGAEQRVTDNVRVGVGMRWSRMGTFVEISLHRLGQSLRVPIQIAAPEFSSFRFSVATVMLPTVVALALDLGVARPRKARKAKIRAEFLRKVNRVELKKKREKAWEERVMMRGPVERKREVERERRGLVIIRAFYGDEDIVNLLLNEQPLSSTIAAGPGVGQDSADDLHANEQDDDPFIDVSVPLQALVESGRLEIPPKRPKSGLIGFCDPCMGTRKALVVEYELAGRRTRRKWGDVEEVRLMARQTEELEDEGKKAQDIR